jgi:hypothetical protein
MITSLWAGTERIHLHNERSQLPPELKRLPEQRGRGSWRGGTLFTERIHAVWRYSVHGSAVQQSASNKRHSATCAKLLRNQSLQDGEELERGIVRKETRDIVTDMAERGQDEARRDRPPRPHTTPEEVRRSTVSAKNHSANKSAYSWV